MLNDPRLSRNNVRVHRRDHFKKRPVLSATIHPKIKRTLVEISERTGMSATVSHHATRKTPPRQAIIAQRICQPFG